MSEDRPVRVWPEVGSESCRVAAGGGGEAARSV